MDNEDAVLALSVAQEERTVFTLIRRKARSSMILEPSGLKQKEILTSFFGNIGVF